MRAAVLDRKLWQVAVIWCTIRGQARSSGSVSGGGGESPHYGQARKKNKRTL